MARARFLLALLAVAFTLSLANADSVRTFRFDTFDHENRTLFSFANFASIPAGSNSILLTDFDADADDSRVETAAVWYKQKVRVNSFTTTFTMRISNNSAEALGNKDGLAFVIQTQRGTVVGPGEGGIGYGDTNDLFGGIRKSIAIEFDTYLNADLGDMTSNHVSFHTLGATENSAAANARLPPGDVSDVPAFAGAENTVTIVYANNTFTVTFQGFGGPSVVIPNINLTSLIDFGTDGAWIGFTAACQGVGERHEILSWNFDYTSIVDPLQSFAVGPNLNGSVAGETGSFVIQAVDQFGYPMITGGLTVGVNLVPSVPDAVVNVVDNNNGTYSVTYTVTQSGSYSFNATINGTPIRNSPYAMIVSPAAVNASNSPVSGSLTGGVAGVVQALYIRARDRFGNNVTADSPALTFVANFSNGMSNTSTYLGNATYQILYYIEKAGTYNVGVTLNGETVGDSAGGYSILIVAADPNANSSIVTGDGLVGGEAGYNRTFTVALRDRFGNPILFALPANWSVSASFAESNGVPITLTSQVDPDTNGTLIFGQYMLTVAQSYSLSLKLQPGDVHIASSPYAVKVTPGVETYPPECVASGSGLRGSVAGQIGYFQIQARDRWGNNQTSSNATFVVTFTDLNQRADSVAVNVTQDPNDAGKVIVQYRATSATTYRVRMTANGQEIKDGTRTNVVVVAAEIYPPSCYAEGPGLSDPRRDVKETFSVITVDRFNNPLSVGGHTVTAQFTDGFHERVVNVTVTDTGRGIYEAEYTLSDAGHYALSIKANGEHIQYSPYFFTLENDDNITAKVAYIIVAVVVGLGLLVAAGVGAFIWYRWRQRGAYTELGE